MIYTFEFSFVMSKERFFLIHTGEGKLGVKIRVHSQNQNKDLSREGRVSKHAPSIKEQKRIIHFISCEILG